MHNIINGKNWQVIAATGVERDFDLYNLPLA
jgi:hypothetical protein